MGRTWIAIIAGNAVIAREKQTARFDIAEIDCAGLIIIACAIISFHATTRDAVTGIHGTGQSIITLKWGCAHAGTLRTDIVEGTRISVITGSHGRREEFTQTIIATGIRGTGVVIITTNTRQTVNGLYFTLGITSIAQLQISVIACLAARGIHNTVTAHGNLCRNAISGFLITGFKAIAGCSIITDQRLATHTSTIHTDVIFCAQVSIFAHAMDGEMMTKPCRWIALI